MIARLMDALTQKPVWEEFCLLARLMVEVFPKCATCRRVDPGNCAHYPEIRDEFLRARRKGAADEDAAAKIEMRGDNATTPPPCLADRKSDIFCDRLLRLWEAAEHVGLHARTMRKYRAAGRGPASVRICGRELYLESTLNAWAETQRSKPRRKRE
ncbi:MAG: hypothetical protein FWD68_17505 [Alphaproteobacteria bacterium]|nr:hypothetical protein [Alphaproteobacteria bacterium]